MCSFSESKSHDDKVKIFIHVQILNLLFVVFFIFFIFVCFMLFLFSSFFFKFDIRRIKSRHYAKEDFSVELMEKCPFKTF